MIMPELSTFPQPFIIIIIIFLLLINKKKNRLDFLKTKNDMINYFYSEELFYEKTSINSYRFTFSIFSQL